MNTVEPIPIKQRKDAIEWLGTRGKPGNPHSGARIEEMLVMPENNRNTG